MLKGNGLVFHLFSVYINRSYHGCLELYVKDFSLSVEKC